MGALASRVSLSYAYLDFRSCKFRSFNGLLPIFDYIRPKARHRLADLLFSPDSSAVFGEIQGRPACFPRNALLMLLSLGFPVATLATIAGIALAGRTH